MAGITAGTLVAALVVVVSASTAPPAPALAAATDVSTGGTGPVADTGVGGAASLTPIDPADPADGVTLIEAPEESSDGAARLRYPIKVPPGRLGMQPTLALAYDSSGGNSWVGKGWDLSVSSIAVDTRFGVPRYDPTLESESYVIEGQELAPNARRESLLHREVDRVFTRRIEGSFDQIIRHGDSPKTCAAANGQPASCTEYWWEVIDQRGVRSFYGGLPGQGYDPNSTLADADGHLYRWGLRKIVDPFGNAVVYSWDRVTDSAGLGLTGRELYPARIRYTDKGAEHGLYTVTFTRDHAVRPDTSIDARSGALTVMADRLTEVEVALDGVAVRTYRLTYRTGAFGKSLLASVREFAADGTMFTQHAFDYHNDTGNYGFAKSSPWDTGADDVTAGLIPQPVSALGGSLTTRGNGHAYIGFNPLSGSKQLSFGASLNGGGGQTIDVLSLLDLNGDGLADKVFMRPDGVWWRPNGARADGTTTFGPRSRVIGLPEIGTENQKSFGFGAELHAIVDASTTRGLTWSQGTAYFRDVNADGLPDLVTADQVLFNATSANGEPSFGPDSGRTDVSLPSASIEHDAVTPDYDAQAAEVRENTPPLDTLRRWTVPYTGQVSITGDVVLANAGPAPSSTDGVRVAIQHNGAELWSDIIGPRDATAHAPSGVENVAVKAGDRLYFRVQSRGDGTGDQVEWNPHIDYVGADRSTDANNVPAYHFSGSGDFALTGRPGTAVQVPFDGRVRVVGELTKSRVTTDNLRVQVLLNGQPVLNRFVAWNTTGPIPVDQTFDVRANDSIELRVRVDSGIDATELRWNPQLYYTSAPGQQVVDERGDPAIRLRPPYSIDVYPLSTHTQPQQAVPLGVPAGNPVVATPRLTVPPRSNGSLVLTFKRPGRLLGKTVVRVVDGVVQPTSVTIPTQFGTSVYIDYSTRDRALLAIHDPKVRVAGRDLPAVLHGQPGPGLFPPDYRGWSYAGYNGAADRATRPVDESRLTVPSKSQDTYDPRTTPSYPFTIFPEDGSWRGPLGCTQPVGTGCSEAGAWVRGGRMSSTRLGGGGPVPVEATGAGRGLVRASFADQNTGAAGVVGFSGSATWPADAPSWGQTEYIDLNGDGFPDVVGDGRVQYTTAVGGLGPVEPFQSSFIRQSLSNASNVGFGGNPAAFMQDARGAVGDSTRGTPGGGSTGSQLAEFGVGISASVGDGDSRTVSDLVDINGDGLPDRLTTTPDGELWVALNLGYSFADRVRWGAGALDRGTSRTVSLGGGFNDGIYGFAGGASGTRTDASTVSTLLDVNGDGLPDRISTRTDALQVGLNTGTGFEKDRTWSGGRQFDDVASSVTRSAAVGAYFTIGVGPLCILACYLIINPGGDTSQSVASQHRTLRDVNGDGAVDVVSSHDDARMDVALGQVGRSNLLSTVDRPLGGRLEIEYRRAGNTTTDPAPRWVMSRVTVDDGQSGDGVDRVVTAYDYSGGVYDRAERTFLGFGRVNAALLTGDGGVRRTTVIDYDNASVETHGLPLLTTLQDAEGRSWIQVARDYDLRDVQPGSRFPALVRTTTRWFEGGPQPRMSTSTDVDYDTRGSIIRTLDRGDTGPNDDLLTETSYSNCPTSGVHLPTGITSRDGAGQVLKRTEQDVDCSTGMTTGMREYPGGGDPVVTDYEFDPVTGNLVSETGPENLHGDRYTLRYTYDTRLATHVASVTDNFGLTTTTRYDDRWGAPLATTDANGATTTWTYDDFGRVTSVRNAADAQGPPTVAYQYHPDASTPWAATHRRDELRGPGSTLDTIVLADGNDRTIQVKQSATVTAANGTAQDVLVVSGHVVYDAAALPIQQFYPVTEQRGTPGIPNRSTDNASSMKTAYDVMDRPTSVTLPDGTGATMTYGVAPDRDGVPRLFSTVVDAEQHRQTDFTDTRGQTVAVRRWYAGGSDPPAPVWSSYGYDAAGRPTARTDAAGNTSRTTYDALGRRVRIATPDGGTTDLVYDPASNLVRRITPTLRATDQAITYDYDLNRLIAVDYPGQADNDVTYSYGNLNAGEYTAGRVASVTDATGTRTIGYDVLGNQSRETETLTGLRGGSETYTTRWAYDDSGRLRTLTHPDGAKVFYQYDSGGRPNRVTGHVRGVDYDYVRRIGYDRFGQRVLLENGNGVTTKRTYDQASRRLSTVTSAGRSDSPFQNLRYGYDGVGNVVSVHNDVAVPPASQYGGPSRQTFAYDDLGRLIEATGNYWTSPRRVNHYTQSLRYDVLDNLTHKSQVHSITQPGGSVVPQHATTYSADYRYNGDQPHAVTSVGDRDLSYNASGNQTGWTRTANGTRRTVSWDDESRITSVSDNGRTTRYVYDDAGRRVVRTGPGGQTVAVSPYFTVRNGSTRLEHVFVDGDRIATRVSHANASPPDPFANDVYFYHPDQLGNVSAVTDEDGKLFEHIQYFPGGEIWVDERSVTTRTPYLFGGHELDADTGLYNTGGRYYDPRAGHFLSPDPALAQGARDPRQQAAYTWAENNPATFTDLNGWSAQTTESVVAEPGFWESLIPVWGSGRQAVHDFQTGHYIRGTVYTALAISDVFLLKSIGVGIYKAAIGKGGIKFGGASWSVVRRWYKKNYGVEEGMQVHHWLVHQKLYENIGNRTVRNVARKIFNQPWNLMPIMGGRGYPPLHTAIHNWATITEKFWYGTPQWAKAAAGSMVGRALTGAASGAPEAGAPPADVSYIGDSGADSSPESGTLDAELTWEVGYLKPDGTWLPGSGTSSLPASEACVTCDPAP